MLHPSGCALPSRRLPRSPGARFVEALRADQPKKGHHEKAGMPERQDSLTAGEVPADILETSSWARRLEPAFAQGGYRGCDRHVQAKASPAS